MARTEFNGPDTAKPHAGLGFTASTSDLLLRVFASAWLALQLRMAFLPRMQKRPSRLVSSCNKLQKHTFFNRLLSLRRHF